MEAVGYEIGWPVEMLGRFLHFLAMDGAESTWKQLAFITHKSSELKNIAERMQRPLVLRVRFDGEGANSFILPFWRATVHQIEIDWGDDTPNEIITDDYYRPPQLSHEYEEQGREYTVRVFPHGPGVDGVWLDHLGWNVERTDVPNFDTTPWWRPLRSLNTLGSLGISSLEALFYNASQFNLALSKLNVSNVENMSLMFCHARRFNQPVGNWDTSKARNMSHMFCHAMMFNRDISRWNVSNVTDMSRMFSEAVYFNQPIGTWDVSRVADMSFMFFGASSFNQPLDGWNLSSVKNVEKIFGGAPKFNQDIGNWDLSNAKGKEAMFVGALEHYRKPKQVSNKLCCIS